MTRATTVFVLILAAGYIAGCAAPFSVASGAPGALPFERLRPEPVPYRLNTGFGDSTRTVIRDRETWVDTWGQIHASTPDPPPLLEIDFSREMVVVAALGTRGSGGYSILIDDVFDRGDSVEVAVVRDEPGQGCLTTAALTAPVDVVRLQRDERPVRFTEHRNTTACE